MFSDVIWLYLFVKLNEIRNLFDGYGISAISILIIFVIICAYYPLKNAQIIKEKLEENSSNEYEIDGSDIWQEGFKEAFPKYFKIWIVIFCFEMCLNMLGTFIPSTQQAAVIYFGVQAKNSETVNILSKLPSKYARIVEMQVNKYMCDTAKESFGQNLPIDIQEMCGIKIDKEKK